ncbi:HLH-domain-containing protein [Hesseltinella vesiculosa]|uniref:HLH-domain-containing protein n=1 Tax=Hesseltinella vesiculosa TaxID=101127 RepID=A0A1X2GIT8_9FUNG|nr:HLH-domain-containing protein [Hesseltinella vesiculosa]
MNTDSSFTFDDYIMHSPYHSSQKPELDPAFQGYPSTMIPTTNVSSYMPAVFDLPDTPPATSPPLLTTSSSTSTTSSSLSEKIAKVNTLPESFLPQFHQYSKEAYENGRKRKTKRSGKTTDDDSNSDEDLTNATMTMEMRRQIHIQSEQKRRAQISDGFQELRQHLPGCINKKMSKAALLHRTVQHLQHLKKNQSSLLTELERLVRENEQLNKFQESVLQKQALDRMYQVPL